MTPEESRKDPLVEQFDATVWAKEFMALQTQMSPPLKIDQETMIAWFSNSIMAGYDHARRKLEPEIESLREQVSNLSKDKWLRSEEIAEGAKKLAEKEWEVERWQLIEGIKKLRCALETDCGKAYTHSTCPNGFCAFGVDAALKETATLLGGEER